MRTSKVLSSTIAAGLLAVGLMAFPGAAGAQGESRFLGKGEVQEVLGWNNAMLQASAGDLQFRTVATESTDYSWTCVNANNEQENQRTRVVSETIVNTFQTTARDRRGQVTGFILTPGTVEIETASEGPKVGSCPSGPWSLEGEVVAVQQAELTAVPTLELTVDGSSWVALG
jgi:hypothetical protein